MPTLSKATLAVIVFGFSFIALLFRWCCGVMLHQLCAPVMTYPYLDPALWVLHLLHIPEFLTGNAVAAWCFDIGMLVSAAVLTVWQPRGWVAAWVVCVFLYMECYNTYGGSHTHCLVGLLFAPIPFLFREPRRFAFAMQGLRYYTLWIYASAFGWKLLRGFMWQPLHGSGIIAAENALYLHQHPNTWLAHSLQWLILHPPYAQIIVVGGALLQSVFWVGFFTKRFDKLLFVLPFLFHAATYFLLDVVFYEVLVLQVAFFKVSARKEGE